MTNNISAANIRDRKFDILRGIGIIYMVMGHVGFGDGFNHYIHAFHMPIFFFVSGYFFYGRKCNRAFDFLKHDLRTLILPYTFFWGLCQILHYLYTNEFSISYSILSYFTSNHNRIDVAGAYWFLFCLFTSKQLFYFIHKKCKGKLFLGIILILTFAGNVMRSYVKLPLCLDSAMSCQLLIYLGYKYHQYKDHPAVYKMMNLPIWALILGVIANGFLIMVNEAVNIRTNYYGIIPLYWINCIFAIVLYLQISERLEHCGKQLCSFISGVTAYIGRNSMVFLVLNELAIFSVERVWSILCLPYGSSFPGHAIIFVITMVCLTIANEIIGRTKLRVLVGK